MSNANDCTYLWFSTNNDNASANSYFNIQYEKSNKRQQNILIEFPSIIRLRVKYNLELPEELVFYAILITSEWDFDQDMGTEWPEFISL